MGQAALDLPDPLNPSLPPTIARTDDLLSQLAGDEIDRLLKAADVESIPVQAGPATPDPTQLNISAQLDNLFTQLDLLQDSTSLPPDQMQMEPGEFNSSSAVYASDEVNEPEDQSLDAAERDLLNSISIPNDPARADRAQPTIVADSALPFYLRPLEWINAPFAAWSERSRQIMGRIAIITLGFSIAILVYVLIFRPN